jgi:hypothetical protein
MEVRSTAARTNLELCHPRLSCNQTVTPMTSKVMEKGQNQASQETRVKKMLRTIEVGLLAAKGTSKFGITQNSSLPVCKANQKLKMSPESLKSQKRRQRKMKKAKKKTRKNHLCRR